MSLTREQLLSGVSPAIRKVSVPELSGVRHLYVRQWLASEFAAIDSCRKAAAASDVGEQVRGMAGLAVLSICDGSGAPLLAADDVEAVLRWPFAALNRVALAALRANGLDGDGGSPEGNSPDGQSVYSP